MATHVQLLLAQKIFSRLTSDATLVALVSGRIYDVAPDNTPYPFIDIGDSEFNDFGSHTTSGFEGEIPIHIWTQGTSKKQNMEIGNQIYSLLHNTDLGISNFPTVNFRATFNQIMTEEDNRTHHGLQRYSFILGGNST